MNNKDDELTRLVQPKKLWSRADILTDPCPVPRSGGVYGWFFNQIPPSVPVASCEQWQGATLLYVGILPKKSSPGKEVGGGHIQSRICYHLGKSGKENAEGSTLRMSLGCLLSDTLGIRLRRDGNRFTFGPGEADLSKWLERHALISWIPHPEPWLLEKRAIEELDLPLNLQGNSSHAFYKQLKRIRSAAKAAALEGK